MAFVNLLTPARFGSIELRSRIVMAPMTRSRADADGDPNELMALYYAQRAGAGMILTEGIYPSEQGKGYCRTPGLAGEHQAALWRPVTEAVHDRGGTIVAQIMHCGRIAHADNKQPGSEIVAPSAIAAAGKMYTDTDGGTMQPFPVPRALDEHEIPAVIADYARSAELAVEAGFDGVELHGTSGYLPAQFLSTGTNRRSDRWGGSVTNRTRFFVEAAAAMAGAVGADRVGFRICPANPFNDLHDDDPAETFRCLLPQLSDLGLAYCHVIRLPAGGTGADDEAPNPEKAGLGGATGRPRAAGIDNEALARELFDGPLIVNDSYSPDEANFALEIGRADAVSFARPFISNPDFAQRVANGAPIEPLDARNLYTQGPEGYTTFPSLFPASAEES